MLKTLYPTLEKNLNQIEREDFKNILILTNEGKIPDDIDIPDIRGGWIDGDARFDLFTQSYFFRDVYTSFCSWCIVTDKWISEIAKLLEGKKCIEIMAGNGLISHALQTHGIDITPYDNFSWNYHKTFTTVYDMDAVECASDLTYDYIICSWPPCEGTDICRVVKNMYHKNPKAKLIYIGEWENGCNAPESFFKIVNEVYKGKEAEIIDKANKYFKSFTGIYDRIHLFEPNRKAKRYKDVKEKCE